MNKQDKIKLLEIKKDSFSIALAHIITISVGLITLLITVFVPIYISFISVRLLTAIVYLGILVIIAVIYLPKIKGNIFLIQRIDKYLYSIIKGEDIAEKFIEELYLKYP